MKNGTVKKTDSMKLFKRLFCAALFTFAAVALHAQAYKTAKNIPYRIETADKYASERCMADVYYPDGGTGVQVVVWFHGGGLTGGEKHIPTELQEKGICVVAVNYRLSPRAQHPSYIEDAAAAVAWTKKNIAQYGGDPSKIIVAGHSAGGYLTLMLALDKGYLGKYGIDAAADIVSYWPISGQCVTHNAIRAEMGLSETVPYIDRYAPLYHITAATAPITLVCGQPEIELPQRVAENYFLYQALLSVGNKTVKYYSLPGFDHGTCASPALQLLLGELKK